jgi:hypothetical protein
MKVLLSFQFSPFGRVGGFHQPRFSRLAIADYGGALKCLADETLRRVQNPGFTISVEHSFEQDQVQM